MVLSSFAGRVILSAAKASGIWLLGEMQFRKLEAHSRKPG